MSHLFKISTDNKTKLVTVEGTMEYAIAYITGYVQSIRDKLGMTATIKVSRAIWDKDAKS